VFRPPVYAGCYILSLPGKIFCRPEGLVLSTEFNFTFGAFHSRIVVRKKLPAFEEIAELAGFSPSLPCLAVCDEHTEGIFRRIAAGEGRNCTVFSLVLPSGEENKGWNAVETILKEARKRGLGRDGLFLALGGGVLCDITAFAASIYLRGARLALVPTTLLAMADAALGGKTGIDLEGIKNAAGTFYPASTVFIALETLDSLPEREWKSGMAEIIKAAVLSGADENLDFFRGGPGRGAEWKGETLERAIALAVTVKGRIVEADPRESGDTRALLNLGHSFGHALETAAGLGTISHGEAVAWGMVRACELGRFLGITPPERANGITGILDAWGYDTAIPRSPRVDGRLFARALESDKKKKAGKLRFVVPNETGAEIVSDNAGIQPFLEQLQKKLL
jgi:3-dehydroquinate synthase